MEPLNQVTTIGVGNIIIQGINNSTLTLNVNGEVREIQNQLAELKELLRNLKAQNVKYAEKIYNIDIINEENFGFITGKKAFNESLTKQLILAIQQDSVHAQFFLQKVATTPNWENQLRYSAPAKNIIAYSFVGVIGHQLGKLMAIGNEDFSEAKQRKYIEKCLYIAKRSLDLICFTLISKWWDDQKQKPWPMSNVEINALTHRFDDPFEPSIVEQCGLLQILCEAFAKKENVLALPMPEMVGFAQNLHESSALHQICQSLHTLNEKLDRSQYDLLDCFEAETQLAAFLTQFHFLVNYRMASIKQVSYHQTRNIDPKYLHRYVALGIDSKDRVNAEKINHTIDTVHTDSVLLYRSDNYQNNINLYPFVIDYNTLIHEQGSKTKICFYRSKNMTDDSLDYLFLEDSSIINIETKGILKPDTNLNELLMNNENHKTLNLDCVVDQFREARNCFLGEVLSSTKL